MSGAPAASEAGRGNSAAGRRDGIALGVGAAIIGFVYFGLFNHDFSVNGLRYAGDVELGVDLFHPNHLLPNLLYRGIYLLVHSVGPGWRSIWLMQSVNVVAGVLTALAVAHVALARGAARAVALLIAWSYAFGFAAWNFAEEPDVYVLPALAVAASLAIILPRRRIDGGSVLVLGLLAVFAVLTLQQYVFWYPVLLALLVRREVARGRLVALAIGIPIACLGAYLAVGIAEGRLHDLDGALGWFLGYAWNGTGFGTYRPSPALSARLLGGLLGVGNLAFAYEVILSPLAIVAALAGCVPLLLTALRTARALRAAAPSTRHDAAIVLAWSAANLAFAIWWESRNIEFLFPLWLGVWMLAALAAPALDRRVLAGALVLVAGVNAAVAFVPQRNWPARYLTVTALARHEGLGPGDLLITEELNTIDYLHYFEHTDVQFLPGAVSAAMHASAGIADVRKSIDAALARSQRVYTTELDEHGRLDAIARWFAPLGRNGFDGAIDRDLGELYRGLDTTQQPVPGARRVMAAEPSR